MKFDGVRTFEISRKEIEAMADVVLYTDYCDVKHFLNADRVCYVNRGIYGWNFSCFFLRPVSDPSFIIAICDGYRNKPGIHLPHEVVEKYYDMYLNCEWFQNSVCSRNMDFAEYLYMTFEPMWDGIIDKRGL